MLRTLAAKRLMKPEAGTLTGLCPVVIPEFDRTCRNFNKSRPLCSCDCHSQVELHFATHFVGTALIPPENPRNTAERTRLSRNSAGTLLATIR